MKSDLGGVSASGGRSNAGADCDIVPIVFNCHQNRSSGVRSLGYDADSWEDLTAVRRAFPNLSCIEAPSMGGPNLNGPIVPVIRDNLV